MGPTFVGRIEQAARSELFGGGSSPVRIVQAELGDLAGAIVAALLFNESSSCSKKPCSACALVDAKMTRRIGKCLNMKSPA